MSFTSTNTRLSDSSIHGIREQILANAVTLYPQEVWNSASWQTYNIVKPQEIFEIIISGSEQLRAIILIGSPTVRIVATGPLASNAHNALCGLLAVTCEALSWYTDNLLGKMGNVEECGKGAVDYTMITDGYNFAAERRIIESLVQATCGRE